MRKVGLITTIPVEVLFAAGITPVDLNNIFIADPDPCRLVEQAEEEGFPRNTCSWVKGIYSVVLRDNVDTVIAVMRGDCSNNEAMAEVLRLKGVDVVPFSYPYPKGYQSLKAEIERLMQRFGVDWDEVDHVRRRLDEVRALALHMDEITWRTQSIGGFENHLRLVSTSDFNGDYLKFESDLRAFLATKTDHFGPATPGEPSVRLGFVGVPPIIDGLYHYVESLGARVVFNEVQRQFAMPAPPGRDHRDLVRQYMDYTYPYDYTDRIVDIEREIERREIDGLVHYVQSFCHHQIQDILLRQRFNMPILTLEGDKPGPLDGRSKVRLETFVEMCSQNKSTAGLTGRMAKL